MGCDGGSIPTRCELVKTKKKEERADPAEVTRSRWTLCALSKEPLAPPIVACPQGQLFNKEALLTHLLQKTLPAPYAYIKSLKDVLELKWSENPAWGKVEGSVRFACPVTGIEANGRHGGFSALRGCGCVFSERALREVPTEECLQCRRPFVRATDVLPLNPPPEVAEQLLAEWKARAKTQRKGKKSSKRRAATEAADNGSTTTSTSSSDEGAKPEAVPADGVNGKRKHAENGERKAKEAKKSKDGLAKANGGVEPAAKKARRTDAKSASTPAEDKPSIVAKMSKDVYSSIFLPGGQRHKAATFTHYG